MRFEEFEINFAYIETSEYDIYYFRNIRSAFAESEREESSETEIQLHFIVIHVFALFEFGHKVVSYSVGVNLRSDVNF